MSTAVVYRAQGKINQNVEVGRHHLLADEPVALGGEDTGPTPHDLLAAALASCTAITVTMYAQRKAWKLDDAKVSVTVSRANEITRFERTIQFIGSLDESQRTRLLEIANRCPVHRDLSGRIEIQTILA